MEPDAPPPSAAEPMDAPPSLEPSVGDGMMGEASHWFSQSFNLVICGKRISSQTAKMIILASAAAIVMLVVALSVSLSGDAQQASSGGGAVPGGALSAPALHDFRADELAGVTVSIELQGCYDAGGGLDLAQGTPMPNAAATPRFCASICAAAGVSFFGLNNYNNCVCGSGDNPTSTRLDDMRCSTPCGGVDDVMCGGHNELSVYSIMPLDILPVDVSYREVGCYIDDEQNRDLSGPGVSMGRDASPATCAALCSGYTHFGLQYYSLCFCGNEYGRLGAGNRPDCNTPCDGDALTVCGGYQRNSIYALKSASRRDVIAGGADETFEYVGCYVDTAERSQMMMSSRFVALSVSLILKAWLLRSDEQRQRCERQ